jgi:hypothetical protein
MYITAVVVVFQSWGEATRAEDALLAAGYITLILTGDVDLDSNATWMDVWRPTDLRDENDPRLNREWDQLSADVDKLGGMADEFGLVEKCEPRERAFEYEIDPITRKRLFPQIARYPHH